MNIFLRKGIDQYASIRYAPHMTICQFVVLHCDQSWMMMIFNLKDSYYDDQMTSIAAYAGPLIYRNKEQALLCKHN